jgi:hypothetical protein
MEFDFDHYVDTRSPEEISINELYRASGAPIERVIKLITRLSGRLELVKRKRRNSDTSDISVSR